MSYLERALADGHAKLTGEGKQQKILYGAVNHPERYADPEEQLRAEFWAELIYRYGYEPAGRGVAWAGFARRPAGLQNLPAGRINLPATAALEHSCSKGKHPCKATDHA
jgi:hypothetical protein